MNNCYQIIEDIRNRFSSGMLDDMTPEIVTFLLSKGIKTRQDDGILKKTTISIPESNDKAFVIGLRYIKRDGTCTEDHYLCTNNTIEYYNKSSLEKQFSEYKGTHKQEWSSETIQERPSSITHVNTLSSLYKK